MKHQIILFSILILSACTQQEQEPTRTLNSEKPIPIRITPVDRQNIQLSIQASGTVSSDTEAKPAFKTGGVVSKMHVDEGESVKKGQLLATLDLTEINAQVRQATEAVDKAQRDLQRAQNLYADSVATLENVQDATTALNVAEQNLQMASFNRNYSEIRSPISGKVIRKLVNQGEIVGPGMPAYYILGNNKSDWVIKSGLSDRDWARTKTGDPAEVRFDAYPGTTFTAKVTQMATTANPGSGTFDAELSLTGTPPRLAAGLIASVEIFPQSLIAQTVIPLDALLESNRSNAKVYTVENGTAKALNVKVAFLHQDKAVIQSGLENIESIVTDGAAYLYDGAKVEIIH